MKPGIYDMTNEEYHAVDAISSSYLSRMFESCPAAARQPFPSTAAMNAGSAMHLLALEGEQKFIDNVIEAPCKTVTAKAFGATVDENPGKIVLMDGEIDECYRCVASLFKHPLAKQWLSNGRAEVSAFAIEKSTGLLCKCRPDYVNEDQKRIVDLKFVRDGDADPRRFFYSLRDRYMIQAGWYPAIYAAAVKWDVAQMLTGYITIEKSEKSGYRVECHDVNDDFVAYGWSMAMKMLKQEVECRKNNFWPSYSFPGAHPQILPEHMMEAV